MWGSDGSRNTRDQKDARSVISRLFDAVMNFFVRLTLRIKWILRNSHSRKSDSLACLVGKTAVVTGGNSGIGFSTSVLLASRGCRVIIGCRRNCEKEIKDIFRLTGNDNVIWKPLDLCSLQSTREFVEEVKKSEKKLDILVNNAGISMSKKYISDDGLNCIMQTNSFGPFLLTHLLIDLLKMSTSPKIVFLSSGLAFKHRLSLEHLNWKYDTGNAAVMFNVYSNSKVCDIIMAQEFAEKLKRCGIRVNSADPGVSQTPIFGELDKPGKKSWLYWYFKVIIFFVGTDTMEAAQTTFHLATKDDPKIKSGDHYFKCKPFVKPDFVYDREFCEKIWREIERLVQLTDGEKL